MDISSDEELAIVVTLLDEEEEEIRRNMRRRFWVHQIYMKRKQYGEYNTLFPDLLRDPEKFFKYFRMSTEKFYDLLAILPLSKQNTTFRDSVPDGERLAVTLKFLGYGDSIQSLSFSYRLGESTVRHIIHETCEIIWRHLLPIVMPPPTKAKWEQIADKFWHLLHFPNYLGAIDGRHCVFEKPPKSGSLYFNYKKEFSVVLLALADAEGKFVSVNVGAYGRQSDGGILKSSRLGIALQNGTLNIPPPKKLPGTNITIPHVIVGDEAFPLTKNIMRPFPGNSLENNDANKIYNYRHSNTRRISENSFGMLAKKFRIYTKKFSIAPDRMDNVILATTALHNFLKNDHCAWQPGELERATETKGLQGVPRTGGNNSQEAITIREELKNFFLSDEGAVPWQWKKALGTGRR